MNYKKFSLYFIAVFSLLFSCVITSKNAWDSTRYYASHKVVEYRSGIWMSENATIGDKPGVKKPDESSPWVLLSGKNWARDNDSIAPDRYILNCP